MRIAISGAHAVGKTTLVGALADAIPGLVAVEEPYHALTAAGHGFADPPTVADLEAQLDASLDSIQDAGPAVIFDRCPADFIAYLAEQARPGSDQVAASYWTRAERAMELLDLVVYVPIERPDRIQVTDQYPRLRQRVDRRLRQLLLEDELLPSARTQEVTGSVPERVESVLRALEAL